MAPATGHQQHRPVLSKSLGSNTAEMNVAQDFVAHGRWDVGVINQRTCILIPQRNDNEEAEKELCDPRGSSKGRGLHQREDRNAQSPQQVRDDGADESSQGDVGRTPTFEMSASCLDTVATAHEVADNEERTNPGLLASCVSRPTQRLL